jgi:hypothetical protein
MPSLKTRLNSAIGELKAPFAGGRELIQLLERDHRTFEDLIERIGETSDRAVRTRRNLFAKLRALLIAHEKIEETRLYAVLARHPETAEIVREGRQEHHVADLLLRELSRMDMATDEWRTKAHVLGENLRHHIGEEEREMFPKARTILSTPQLDRLATRMRKDRGRILARESRPAPAKRSRSR